MKSIIFTKYSNDRAEKYNIRTDIMEDESGRKFVRKCAMSQAGETHIESIYRHYEALSEAYKNTKITLNHCSRVTEGAEFEFLTGQTFEEKLDEFLLEKDYSGIVEHIKEYVAEAEKGMNADCFKITREFIEVFGEAALPGSLKSGTVTNIDMVFANAIVRENGWELIDYEWTFDFPIPFHFVVYRMLHYYMYSSSKRQALRTIGLYELFGLTEEEITQYTRMEQHFQQYILGDIIPLRNLYHAISGECLDVQKLADKEIAMRGDRIQIFIDQGNGYSEAESYFIKGSQKKDGNGITFEFPIQQGTKAIRLDPMSKSGIVKMKSILAYGDGCYELPYSSNGFQVFGDTHIFITDDPQFIFTELPSNATSIRGEMYVDVIEEDILKEIASLLTAQREELKSENERLDFELKKQTEEFLFDKRNFEREIAEKKLMEEELSQFMVHYHAAVGQRDSLQRSYNELFEEYQSMLKSRSVQITKPLRFIGRGVKKILKSNKVTYYACKGIISLGKNGWKETVSLAKSKLHPEPVPKEGYHDIVFLSEDEKKRQGETKFKTDVTFSILVPLYNTPLDFLAEMIDSVVEQTYGKWELCLADGSDSGHPEVGEMCMQYVQNDKRVVYKRLEQNKGISENTNECMRMATGNYIALFDHDDVLHPAVLYENMCVIDQTDADYLYTDEATFQGSINNIITYHFKPDFSIDNLRANNYICHFSVFKKSLLDKAGMFRHEYDGSQDHDMILRLTEQAARIEHIPKILYYWRSHPNSVSADINSKTYAIDAGKRAVLAHLQRAGLIGTVESSRAFPTIFRIKYLIQSMDKISIIIPNCDHIDDLRVCINSIRRRSTYPNYEIILIENNSKDEKTFAYYEIIQQLENVKVLYWDGPFNYAAINNYAAQHAEGKYLLFLNNDTEVIEPMWMEEMVMYAQREDVAAVGAKLYFDNDTIQHAGIILGFGADGVAGHGHFGRHKDDVGYMGRLFYAHDVSAVTAACLMVRKNVFEEVSGFEEEFVVAYNDVDLCMKFRSKGYLNVFTPYAELYHYESRSRGYETTPEKQARFQSEAARFRQKWARELKAGDPFYNPNMSLDKTPFEPK